MKNLIYEEEFIITKKAFLKLRRYFLTGLLVILPVFLTVYILFVIVRFIDGLWGSLINLYIRRNFGFSIPGLGLILALLTVILTGFFATRFFGKKIIPVIEGWFLKFPFIRTIYPPAKQIVNFFLSKERSAFKKVALVEYPSKGIWSVGFVTNEGFLEAQQKTGRDLLHVFIASTPSPLTGYFVLVSREDVKFLEMSVEEGIKLIVSGGILKP